MEDILVDTGLSKNEAKVYCVLNELGSSTAGTIAAKSKVHRPNCYDALKRLVNKGLVSYIVKDGKNYYSTTDPENLLRLVEEKQQKVKAILGQLKLARNLAQNKDSAQILYGIQGVRFITEDILSTLKKGNELVTFGVPNAAHQRMKHFVPMYHKRRMAKGIIQRHLCNSEAKERIKFLNTFKYTHASYLPKEYDSPVTTTVYANKVVFWLWERDPLTIIVESEAMAKAYRKYFDLLWSIARRHKA